jgi:hypothetical protein
MSSDSESDAPQDEFEDDESSGDEDNAVAGKRRQLLEDSDESGDDAAGEGDGGDDSDDGTDDGDDDDSDSDDELPIEKKSRKIVKDTARRQAEAAEELKVRSQCHVAVPATSWSVALMPAAAPCLHSRHSVAVATVHLVECCRTSCLDVDSVRRKIASGTCCRRERRWRRSGVHRQTRPRSCVESRTSLACSWTSTAGGSPAFLAPHTSSDSRRTCATTTATTRSWCVTASFSRVVACLFFISCCCSSSS